MKRCSKLLSFIGIVFFVVGIVILINATNMGMNVADEILQKFGSMDTEKYYMIMKSMTNSYLVGGAIIAIIGGLTSIVFGYLTVKMENQ